MLKATLYTSINDLHLTEVPHGFLRASFVSRRRTKLRRHFCIEGQENFTNTRPSCVVLQGLLLLGLHLGDAVHKVLVRNLHSLASQSRHTSLNTHGLVNVSLAREAFAATHLQLSAVEILSAASQLGEVDVCKSTSKRQLKKKKRRTRICVHLARVNLHDASAGFLVREREFDLTIETTRTKEGRIQDVNTVRGCAVIKCRREGSGMRTCDNLHTRRGGEAVQLIQELKHSALHLAVTRDVRIETLRSDGIQLINKDNSRSLLLR